MSALLPLPFALPLVAAALGLLFRSQRAVQRVITAALLTTLVVFGGALVAATSGGRAVAVDIGNWPVELAIAFAADGFSALVLLTVSVSAVLALVFAVSRGEDAHPLFHPMVAVLLAGVLGSLLTADLFNLFVTFEVMLIGSYVLLTLRGGRRQVRAGVIYVTVSLLASTTFLVGIALLYGTAGTVAFAQLYGVVQTTPTAAVGASMIAAAIAVKASLVPMHAWLPRTYVQAGPGVTALFSGLLTKAGVYVLFRLYSVLFAGDPGYRSLWLAVAGVTMVVGVLGAVGRGDMRGILAYHMVSQVGYLILPLGLWSLAGVTAGIVYLMQYVLVKGALFVAVGAVETLTGTGKLQELGGMVRTRPWLALGFLFPALALAGIPPTSGFVGKYLLIRAAFVDAHWVAGGVAVLVSLFTLLSMVKIWNGAFWGELTDRSRQEPAGRALGLRPVPAGGAGDSEPPVARAPSNRRVAGMVGPTLLVAVAVFVLGIGAQPLIELVEPAAQSLLEPTAYLEAVRSL
ncbi:monovalent cation/H+ antiporter subunit D family protein [Egicoccus halophilus]|uniref:Cation:proton antiporter n=1 Tax=Egicoccus halophilus TaxID=1670830 RepID=A0A8J3A985_9ACTN|nr:monovalent cation/H+ antiporter subunit D family protein [Egicoccus halophilus]GGI05238.1 cation:proton antiporter [Egicoccus halophilus]